MSPRVLITGHWNGGDQEEISVRRALELLARGFQRTRPQWDVIIHPLGPGPAFGPSLESAADIDWCPISVAVWEETTRKAGHAVLEAVDAGKAVVIEGGHNIDVDAGLGFLSVISGIDVDSGAPRTQSKFIIEALDQARIRLGHAPLVMAASTRRPLLGMASVLAVGVDLSARTTQDRELTSALTSGLKWPEKQLLPLSAQNQEVVQTHPGRIEGSGAGGGIGAIVAALGGLIVPTGDFLISNCTIREDMAQVDLVIIAEPHLHSPQLAEATLDAVTELAQRYVVPVVAVGVESSLSHHEKAEWGIHGVMTTHGSSGLEDMGARIAHTWAPRSDT
ncbi:glycerate kinase [Schaalia vaccimaxillae]|uniref:glycerate kinase n=1 Tax=Schaalia vaccimaxillae TaxID=183916 RepID=UPI0003B5BF34|nr:glycerate kinase [Schaalia vaccimaxillae]